MARILVIAAALIFIAGFAFLTVTEVADQGFTAGTLVSLIVLTLLTVGIVGALRNPPR